MGLLKSTIENIHDLDKETMVKSRERIDNLIKPKGSLGKLEEIAVKLTGITGDIYPKVDKKTIIVMAADNGVCEEGIASAPQVVTKMQAINMTKGICGVSALAKQANADVVVVDVGIMSDVDDKNIIHKKVRYGTDNFKKGPAMLRKEAILAIEVGIEVTEEEIKKGCNLLGTGEMSIGNTTPSTAILSVLGKYEPKEITGVGANLPETLLTHKANVIKDAIELNKPNVNDPIDILTKIGGLDICGMVGVILAGAVHKVPVVIDGYISTISALIACKIEPQVINYIFTSHSSAEKGAKYATELLGLKPMLDMDMRLGEGTGAALTFNIIEAATYMMKEMVTFEESEINPV